jgi:hypothetical protein
MTLLKPANGSRAEPTKHGATFPSAPQEGIETARPPDGQHVPGIATANIDYIALGNDAGQVAWLTEK